MESISFTVPLKPSLLRAVAATLVTMAEGLPGAVIIAPPGIHPAESFAEPDPGALMFASAGATVTPPMPPVPAPDAFFEGMTAGLPADVTVPPMPPVVPPASATGGDFTHGQLAGPELDKEGVPWDERIHVSTRTKTQKGVWTIKKGLDPAFVEATKNQLRANQGVAAPPTAGGVAPVTAATTTTAPPPPNATAGVPSPAPANVDYATPATTTTQPAVHAELPTTFAAFIVAITPHTTSGRLTIDDINNVVTLMGLTGGFQALQHREELIPQVYLQLMGLKSCTAG